MTGLKYLKIIPSFTNTCLAKLFMLGFTSLAVQILLLQEFLGIVAGNEFTVSAFLCLWMLFTSFGARLQTWISPDKNINSALYIALSILPVWILFSLRYFKNLIFEPGISLDPWQIIWYSAIHLFPICTVSGYLFVVFSIGFSNSKKNNGTSIPLSIESVGSIAGISLFALILPWFLEPFQILMVLFAVNGIFLLISSTTTREWITRTIVLICLSSILVLFPPAKISFQSLFPGQNLELQLPSPHGTITVTTINNQKLIYENGQLLYYSNNEPDREESVHFAMAQHPCPKNVLLISGGMNGMLAEIEKYQVQKIDYLEINKTAAKYLKNEIPGINHPAVELIHADPVRYLQKNRKLYDVIIVATPDPVNMKLNRFYTLEFVKNIQKSLGSDGVCILKFNVFPGYLDQNDLLLVSSLKYNLSAHFKNTLLLPTEKLYFLASNSKLSLSIDDTLQKKFIETIFVNKDYFDFGQISNKSQEITIAIENLNGRNSNLHPISYGLFLKKWYKQHGFSKFWFLLPIIAFLATIVWIVLKTPGKLASMFLIGFSASSMQIILLFLFQSFLGLIHFSIVLVTIVYMAGLALGAFKPIVYKSDKSGIPNVHFAFSLITVFVFISSLWFHFLLPPVFFIYLIYCTLYFAMAFLAGQQYLLTTRYYDENGVHASSKTYSIDLLGAAIGCFIFPVFVVPAAGIFFCIALIAFLNLFLMLLLRKK